MRRFVFEVVEGIRIAGQAIWANKLRSTLTTLGVIIGIAAVTLMATVINGLNQEFDKALSQLGTDVLYVDQFPWGQNADREWWRLRNRPAIQPALAQTIRERSRYAEAVAPMTDTDRQVQYQGQSMEAEILGSPPQYGRIRSVKLAQGRFYTRAEERGRRHVCVIGATVAQELFPAVTPLGKEVKIGDVPCTVIGVQEKKGESMLGGPGSPDERILMPFSTYDKLFGVSRQRGVEVMVKVGSAATMTRAEEELIGIIRTARGVAPGERNNFAINDQQQVMASFASTRIAIYGVGLFLTGLALVVGGIGVMNIMFVSVRERTKEIGIRKAVGAKQHTILFQFLVEAVIVCLIGGVMGLGVSALGAMGVRALGFTASLPAQTVVLAFGICVGVGILFGIAPAWQAATADPIEALRYE
ncbi:MAG: ABC transporter permease [Salinibacter sp.]|uniref:ABC transporter permease n=1 Tax=Salinibacter sp. TaxID=2065818 RepID=UPI0035D424B4